MWTLDPIDGNEGFYPRRTVCRMLGVDRGFASASGGHRMPELAVRPERRSRAKVAVRGQGAEQVWFETLPPLHFGRSRAGDHLLFVVLENMDCWSGCYSVTNYLNGSSQATRII